MTFQAKVTHWANETFGSEVATDPVKRTARFLEEALELVQANGFDRDAAHRMVEYVFDRPIGERYQEVGGVLVTLAALCSAYHIDMQGAANNELRRCWKEQDRIAKKRAPEG